MKLCRIYSTLSWRRPLSYRNQFIDLQSKSVNWFLYDNGLCHERVRRKCSENICNFVIDWENSPLESLNLVRYAWWHLHPLSWSNGLHQTYAKIRSSEIEKVDTSSIWRLIIVVMMKETLSMGILVIEFVEFLITFVKSWILEIDKSLYGHKSISWDLAS